MTSDPRLFDPRTTLAPRCAYCDTQQPERCQWARDRHDGGDLEGKPKPRTCLQRHDPHTAPFPDTY